MFWLSVSEVLACGHLAPLFLTYDEVEHHGWINLMSKPHVNKKQHERKRKGHRNMICPPGTHCFQPDSSSKFLSTYKHVRRAICWLRQSPYDLVTQVPTSEHSVVGTKPSPQEPLRNTLVPSHLSALFPYLIMILQLWVSDTAKLSAAPSPTSRV